MRYAIIENGVVSNVAEADEPLSGNWVESGSAGIGWAWDGSMFSPPPVDLEALASQVRAQRDELLTASDWTQVADAPVDQAAWASYRQALRDIPQQEGFPENVIWPEQPV